MRTLSRFLLVAIFSTVLVGIGSSVASAATKKTTKLPVITSVSPRSLSVGEKLTIRGKYFRPGPLKTQVAFYRSGRPIVFLKAQTATSTKLTVTVTEKVQSLFKDAPTKPRLIRLRILTTKLSKSWTKNSKSVTIDPVAKQGPPNPTPTGTTGTTPPAALTCEQRAASNGGGDEDADKIDNETELRWGMNPCKGDSDGDGVNDAFEYFSSQDLNGIGVFNGKRPSPNPNDANDANKDFDGDGLTMIQEYQLWVAGGAPAYPAMSYSDGKQQSVNESVTGREYLDLNADGWLTDDERDFDSDRLSNMIEFNMAGQEEWWNKVKWRKRGTGTEFDVELPYNKRVFSNVDATNRDTDGDGVTDELDDQDNDGWNNFLEMQYTRNDLHVRVQPFNPCLPRPNASTCWRLPAGQYPPAEKTFPPFDGDDSNPPTVVACEDYETVRWPFSFDFDSPNPDVVALKNALASSGHPITNIEWNGQTGLLGPNPALCP